MEQVGDAVRTRTPTEKRSYRRYLVEFLTGMALYSVLLVVSVTTLRHHQVGGFAGIAIALLPMLGVLAVAYAIVHYTLCMDEFKRRITIDSAAVAALAGGVITMGLGFLENAGVPHINMIYTFPIIIAVWGCALMFFWQRYR